MIKLIDILREIKINNPTLTPGKIATEFRNEYGWSIWKRKEGTNRISFHTTIGNCKQLEEKFKKQNIKYPFQDGKEIFGIDPRYIEEIIKEYVLKNKLYKNSYTEEN